MHEITIKMDFMPDRIEVYQLIQVYESKTEGSRNVLKVDSKGNILAKEKQDG